MDQANQALLNPEKFEAGDNKEYKIEAIIASTIYGQKVNNQILGFYYFILWKSYPKDKNT